MQSSAAGSKRRTDSDIDEDSAAAPVNKKAKRDPRAMSAEAASASASASGSGSGSGSSDNKPAVSAVTAKGVKPSKHLTRKLKASAISVNRSQDYLRQLVTRDASKLSGSAKYKIQRSTRPIMSSVVLAALTAANIEFEFSKMWDSAGPMIRNKLNKMANSEWSQRQDHNAAARARRAEEEQKKREKVNAALDRPSLVGRVFAHSADPYSIAKVMRVVWYTDKHFLFEWVELKVDASGRRASVDLNELSSLDESDGSRSKLRANVSECDIDGAVVLSHSLKGRSTPVLFYEVPRGDTGSWVFTSSWCDEPVETDD